MTAAEIIYFTYTVRILTKYSIRNLIEYIVQSGAHVKSNI